MYVIFLFLMVEGRGGGLLRDEVQALVLLQRSWFLEDLAILDNNADYRSWEITETTKNDIFTDICFTFRIRGDGSTSKWK